MVNQKAEEINKMISSKWLSDCAKYSSSRKKRIKDIKDKWDSMFYENNNILDSELDKAFDGDMRRKHKLLMEEAEAKKKAEKEAEKQARKAARKKKYKQHTASTSRQQAKDRDGNKCAICGRTEYLEVHHIKHKADGGTDDLDNLITLCDCCHIDKHRGESIAHLMVSKAAEHYF